MNTAVLSLRRGASAEFLRVTPSCWDEVAPAIIDLEKRSFPPSIRDSAQELRKLAHSPTAIFLIVRIVGSGDIVGNLAADRLENFPEVPAVQDDPHFGRADTIYIASVAIRADWRGQGLGIALQTQCLRLAEDAGFKRVTAHIEHGATARMGVKVETRRSFKDWYGTGKTFDYVVFSLQPRR